jgi:L-asparaginase/Glu-tRNA(Gln) amidotransferase subunit D
VVTGAMRNPTLPGADGPEPAVSPRSVMLNAMNKFVGDGV